jgi:hypothetical protein
MQSFLRARVRDRGHLRVKLVAAFNLADTRAKQVTG